MPSKTIQVVIFFSKIILNHHLLLLRSFLTAVIEHIWNQFKSAPVNDDSKYAKPETGELKFSTAERKCELHKRLS